MLAVLVAEAAWLAARGRPTVMVVAAVLPGVMFVLALRAALVGAGWPWVALPLALSGPAHLIDLRCRPVRADRGWREALSGRPPPP